MQSFRHLFLVISFLNLGIGVKLAEAADSTPNPSANAQLVQAIMDRNLTEVKAAFDAGADPNHKVRFLRDTIPTANVVIPVVLLATCADHLFIAKELLDRGADINVSITSGIYPYDKMHSAIAIVMDPSDICDKNYITHFTKHYPFRLKETIEFYELFLSYGMEFSGTALGWAVDSDNLILVPYLIDSGKFDPNEDKYKGWLLDVATENNSYEMLTLLLSYGMDINFKGKDDDSPLLIASKGIRMKMLKFLYERGARFETCDAIKMAGYPISAQDRDALEFYLQGIPSVSEASTECGVSLIQAVKKGYGGWWESKKVTIDYLDWLHDRFGIDFKSEDDFESILFPIFYRANDDGDFETTRYLIDRFDALGGDGSSSRFLTNKTISYTSYSYGPALWRRLVELDLFDPDYQHNNQNLGHFLIGKIFATEGNRDHIELLRLFHSKGVDFHGLSNKGKTMATQVIGDRADNIEDWQMEILDMLNVEDLDRVDAHGIYPVWQAIAGFSNAELLEYLLSRGALIPDPGFLLENLATKDMDHKNMVNVYKVLFRYSVKLNDYANADGQPFLFALLSRSKGRMDDFFHYFDVAAAFASDFDANIMDSSGRNLLWYIGNDSGFKKLMAAGADIHNVGNDGDNLLMREVRKRNDLDWIKFFVASGLDIEFKDQKGLTAVEIAYQHLAIDSVLYLCSLGAKADICRP